jgi:hypothetical protein
LKTFRLDTAPIGQRVVVIEPMENEVRWRHFERREGVATFNENYVPVYGLRTVQGVAGQKPRWDSGEGRTPSEMPGRVDVVDASEVNHDWDEAYAGLMIVDSSCWTGIYLNGRLLHKISPFESARDVIAMALKLAEAMELPSDRRHAIWNGHVLADDLALMRLRDL